MATPVPSKAPSQQQPTPIKQASKPKSRLEGLEPKRLDVGLRYCIYGPPGTGKTGLAVDAQALIVDADAGSGSYLARRYPFNPGEPDESVPRSYEQLLEALEDMVAHPTLLPRVLALDAINRIEELLQVYVAKQHGEKTIEDVGGGFQKGYKAAIEELNRMLALLEKIQQRGTSILILGHSTTTTFKNPEGEDYDRYNLACNATRNGDFGGRIKQWCDVVGFLHFEGGASKRDPKAKRARGWSTGQRLIELAHSAAWDAKSRLALPATVSLDEAHPWNVFATATVLGTREALISAIEAEHDRITGGARDVKFTTSAGTSTSYEQIATLMSSVDENALTRILGGLRATQTVTAPAQES